MPVVTPAHPGPHSGRRTGQRPGQRTGQRTGNRALDAVRAAAALLVVLEHTRGYLLQPRSPSRLGPVNGVLYPATQVGYGAVLVFFVLSGYFVGGSVVHAVSRDRFDWRVYLVSRLTRMWVVLVPALVLTFVVDQVGTSMLASSIRFAPGSESARNHTVLDLLGNLGFVQGQLVPAFGSNGALWSLAFEGTYYLAFPLLLAGAMAGGSAVRRILLPLLGGWLLLSVDRDVLALSAVWLLGALVAWQQDRLRALVARVPTGLLGLLRMGAVALVAWSLHLCSLESATQTKTVPASFVTGLAAALLVVVLLPDVHPRSHAGAALLRSTDVLAACSFSVYAVHLPLVSLVAALLHPDGDTAVWRPGLPGWALVLAVSAAAVAAGWVSARYTEARTGAVRERLLRVQLHGRRTRRGSAEGDGAGLRR